MFKNVYVYIVWISYKATVEIIEGMIVILESSEGYIEKCGLQTLVSVPGSDTENNADFYTVTSMRAVC
jgi:hypothetical protein